jgi:hypothetical protein
MGLGVANRRNEKALMPQDCNKETVGKTGKDKARNSGVQYAKARGPDLLPPCNCPLKHHKIQNFPLKLLMDQYQNEYPSNKIKMFFLLSSPKLILVVYDNITCGISRIAGVRLNWLEHLGFKKFGVDPKLFR